MTPRKTKPRPLRAVATAAPPAAVVARPRPPDALPLEVRRSIQGLLARIERTTPQLREVGAFELLGLLAQAGHALQLTASHALALERALGLEPPPEEAPTLPRPSTNGVRS